MYTIRFFTGVEATYRRLPPELNAAAKEVLRTLKENPLLGKPLEGELQEYYSARFMRYRIVYAIELEQRIVWVYGLGHRSRIYDYMTEMIGLLRPRSNGKEAAGK